MKAEAMFKEYRTMKKELSVLQFQMSRFQGVDENDLILSMQFSHPEEGERVQTSNISDKTASAAMNYRQIMERENDEWFDFLWSRYRYVSEEISFFESSVAALPGNLSGVMRDLVEGELTWESIAMKYHVTTAMIAKYKKKALCELEAMYELRDRQTEAYILS